MYIPFGFTAASSGSLTLDGLLIWNTYGGYNSSTGIWADLSGNNNTGSVVGTLTDIGGTYLFNGINNAVRYNRQLGTSPTTVFNVSVSVMGTFYNADGVSRWLWNNFDDFGPASGFFQYLRNTANPDDMEFRTTAGGTELSYNAPYTITPGETVMYTITGDPNQINFYKNATLFATFGPYPFDPYVYSANTGFGGNAFLNFGSGSAGISTFSGSVSNLLYYNKTLTAQEVASNYGYLASIL
jgi:hypothetical protein